MGVTSSVDAWEDKTTEVSVPFTHLFWLEVADQRRLPRVVEPDHEDSRLSLGYAEGVGDHLEESHGF